MRFGLIASCSSRAIPMKPIICALHEPNQSFRDVPQGSEPRGLDARPAVMDSGLTASAVPRNGEARTWNAREMAPTATDATRPVRNHAAAAAVSKPIPILGLPRGNIAFHAAASRQALPTPG